MSWGISFLFHSQNATIFSMRRKGPSTSRPASYLRTERPRRTNNVIPNCNANNVMILKRKEGFISNDSGGFESGKGKKCNSRSPYR